MTPYSVEKKEATPRFELRFMEFFLFRVKIHRDDRLHYVAYDSAMVLSSNERPKSAYAL